MQFRALISFSGVVSMTMDEVGEISDQSIAGDLLKAGYIEPVEAEEKPKAKKETKKTPKE